MKGSLTLAVALAIVAFAGAERGGAAAGFWDVGPTQQAYHAVQELTDDGIVTGYPDGTFRGNRPITRYEMALMLDRLLVHLQAQQATTASKHDIDGMQKLIDGVEDEIVSLQTRVDGLEDRAGREPQPSPAPARR